MNQIKCKNERKKQKRKRGTEGENVCVVVSEVWLLMNNDVFFFDFRLKVLLMKKCVFSHVQ